MMMETEQMAAVYGGRADHRQGGAPLARMTGTVEVDEPVTVFALQRVLGEFPEGARLTIEPRGDKPGLHITAEWGGR